MSVQKNRSPKLHGHTRSLQSMWVRCRSVVFGDKEPRFRDIASACSREPHASARTWTAGHERRFASSNGHTSGRSVARRRSRSGRSQSATRAARKPVPDPSSTKVIKRCTVSESAAGGVRVCVKGDGSKSISDAGSRYASIAYEASLHTHAPPTCVREAVRCTNKGSKFTISVPRFHTS